MPQKTYTFDKNLQMKDSTAVTATGNAQVSAADKILNLGTGRVDAVVVLDVSAIDTVTGDEKYEIEAQFSNSPSFASGVVTGNTYKLGGTTAVPGNSAANGTGRYELAICNEIANVLYQYCRLVHRIAGTTPSITYTAYLAKMGNP